MRSSKPTSGPWSFRKINTPMLCKFTTFAGLLQRGYCILECNITCISSKFLFKWNKTRLTKKYYKLCIYYYSILIFIGIFILFIRFIPHRYKFKKKFSRKSRTLNFMLTVIYYIFYYFPNEIELMFNATM